MSLPVKPPSVDEAWVCPPHDGKSARETDTRPRAPRTRRGLEEEDMRITLAESPGRKRLHLTEYV